MLSHFKAGLVSGACFALFGTGAFAQDFNIPHGDLKAALDAYMKQAGISLMYPPASVKGVQTEGVRGELPADVALSHILSGTGFQHTANRLRRSRNRPR